MPYICVHNQTNAASSFQAKTGLFAVVEAIISELHEVSGHELLLNLLQGLPLRLHQCQLHGDGPQQADAGVHPERAGRGDGFL